MNTYDFEPDKTWSQREIDLHEALEHQIDIVLRLEDERLSLLKETRGLKEQIKDLTESGIQGNSVSFALSMDTLPDHKENKEKKDSQEVMTQTEESVLQQQQLVDSGKEQGMKTQLESGQIEKKIDDKAKKRPVADKMPMKSLKFVKGKENQQKQSNIVKEDADKSFQLNTSKIKLDKSNIQELESLKEELAALKMENRFYMEGYKSIEKERNELRQELFNKEESYENLRKEVEHLRTIVASNDYRVVKKLESELRKTKESNKEQTEELIMLRNEKFRLEEELKNFKANLTKLREEYEKESKDDTKLYAIMKEAKRNEAKVKDLEAELRQKDKELSILKDGKEDFLQEKEKLEEDVEYFKQMAKNAKAHAEKAIADVDTYRNMLNEISRNQRR